MRGKKWSPEDVERGLQALAEHGGNATAASRATGIPRTTLIGWRDEHFDEFDDLRREKRISLIDKVWAVAEKAWDLTLEKLKFDKEGNPPGIKARDLVTIAAIATDKGLLLGGEPTEILENREKPLIYLPKVDGEELETE